MKQFMDKVEKAGEFLNRLSCKVVFFVSALVALGLVYYSMFYTESLHPGTEIPMTMVDNPLLNLGTLFAVLLILFGGYYFLVYKAGVKWSYRKTFYVMLVCTLYIAVVAILWISICHIKARADGGSLCLIAKMFMEGRYGTMVPPGYMTYYPHQFSLLFVIHMLFMIFGAGNYQAFQYMNALCLPLLFWSGYRILQLIGARGRVILTYATLFLTYIPLFMYVAYVYGEMTSITFTMVLIWQVIRYCKTKKKICFLWGTLSIVFACMMRMNALIILLAAGIVLLVYAWRERELLPIIWLLIMVMSVFLCDELIRSYYERLTGYEVSDGIPYISYVRMGLQDGERGPGWYDESNYSALMYHDYDTESTARDEEQAVKERLVEFWQNKSYAIDFFRRKILTQWNSPACHAFYETGVFRGEKEDLPFCVEQLYFGEKDDVLGFMDRHQFVLFCGFAIMTCLALFGGSKQRRIEDYLLLISILGGFFFSIVWEAMSRYTLPYMVYMIPVAAIGLWKPADLLSRCGFALRRQGCSLSAPHTHNNF